LRQPDALKSPALSDFPRHKSPQKVVLAAANNFNQPCGAQGINGGRHFLLQPFAKVWTRTA
jgi:hypothetical protein